MLLVSKGSRAAPAVARCAVVPNPRARCGQEWCGRFARTCGSRRRVPRRPRWGHSPIQGHRSGQAFTRRRHLSLLWSMRAALPGFFAPLATPLLLFLRMDSGRELVNRDVLYAKSNHFTSRRHHRGDGDVRFRKDQGWWRISISAGQTFTASSGFRDFSHTRRVSHFVGPG